MIRQLLLALLLTAVIFAPGVKADSLPPLGIAAIVNDEVITTVDLTDRLAFALATSRIEDTAENRTRLMPQILRQLINEALQVQEAKSLGITISDAQVNEAIGRTEVAQGKAKGDMLGKLVAWGVPPQTFTSQIRAQLAWSGVVARKIRPKVKVSEEEIDRARLQPPATIGGGEELLISALNLAVSTPKEEVAIRQVAEKMVQEIQSGKSFAQVATAIIGQEPPDPVWVPTERLDPAMIEQLKGADVQTVAAPLRTESGYTIVYLVDRRKADGAEPFDSQLLIKNILLSLKPEDTSAAAEMLLTIGREVARNPGTCREESIAGVGDLDAAQIDVQFTEARLSELSATLRTMVAPLSVGAVSEPFATPDGIRLIMLCERVDAPAKLADKEKTYIRLMNEKMDLQVQKAMRELRRKAFVELRL